MSFEYLKGIIGIPSGKYKYTCPKCGDPFSTIYIQQIFCLKPCTAQPEKAEKKEVTRMTSAENLARKKEIRKNEEECHALNRKWLSKKL